jgi:hypothetical protein
VLNGVRSIPISNYPEYPVDYYRKVLVHELGLTNRQILALLNGDQVQIPRSASARPPLSMRYPTLWLSGEDGLPVLARYPEAPGHHPD